MEGKHLISQTPTNKHNCLAKQKSPFLPLPMLSIETNLASQLDGCILAWCTVGAALHSEVTIDVKLNRGLFDLCNNLDYLLLDLYLFIFFQVLNQLFTCLLIKLLIVLYLNFYSLTPSFVLSWLSWLFNFIILYLCCRAIPLYLRYFLIGCD